MLVRGQRRRTSSWKASLLIPGTKKEDFLEGQFAYPGDKEGGPVKEGGLPGGLEFAYPGDKEGLLIPGTKKEDFLEDQFAYLGDKEGGLHGGPICLSRGQRRRTSWRASLFLPGTKKEDFLEGQFAYPGDKEGGLPGQFASWGQRRKISRGQRRRTSWRASLLIPGTKKEDFLENSEKTAQLR